MVIDDEPIVGKRLKQIFEKAGYKVAAFTQGAAALQELEKGSYDIIVTDLKMEGVDGMDILKAAKLKNPDAKVIIITGFAKMETATEAFREGVFDFIAKPFKIDELREVILRAEQALQDNRRVDVPS